MLSATPTADEQYVLELVNRGRANPTAEAARYGIDLNEGLAAGTISTAAKQPLAFHPSLVDSARTHSQWMIDNDVFSHYGSSNSTPGQRMTAAGYVFTGSWTWAENIAWSGSTGGAPNTTTTVGSLHRNLFVDSGISGRGHRVNLMNPTLSEIGTGVATGVYQGYNAVMLTQDFAKSGSSVFLTGVAYDDRKVSDDNFYTVGEGLGGVTVTATRLSDNATFSTTTWSSGGYSLALPAGTYRVVASGGTLSGTVTLASVTLGSANVKADFLAENASVPVDPNPVVQAPTAAAGSSLTARRNGSNLQVVTSTGQVLLNRPLTELQSVTVRGVDNHTDMLTVDQATGGVFTVPLVFEGGTGTDSLVLRGTTQADSLAVTMSYATINGLRADFRGIEQLRLEGAAGNDTYALTAIAVPTTVADTGGSDTLDFSGASAGITLNLSQTASQPQQVLAGQGTLALSGTLENVIGSASNDTITGNSSANHIWGRAGLDTIRGGYGNDVIYGEAGNDLLYGEAGNDLVLGGDGNDQLTEASGRNLMIGGAGADTLRGGPGDELLIGGTTAYDTNETALLALLAEWTSANSFATRVNYLKQGGGVNGSYRLIPGTTNRDDLAVDTLYGATGADWFLTSALDKVMDRNSYDRIN